jgi:hypothetical protein
MNSTLSPKKKYEKESRGKVLMRVQLVPTDDAKEWETIKKTITAKFGSAKNGIFELYLYALNSGIFSALPIADDQVKQKYSPLSKAPKDSKNGILIFEETTNTWVISFWRNKKDPDSSATSSRWTDNNMNEVKGTVWTHLPAKP